MQIKKGVEITAPKIKILTYGASSSGKTSLIKTIPKHFKTLVVSAENGLLSVKGHDFDYVVFEQKNIMKQASELYSFISKDKSYDVIFIDSLTEISNNLMLEISTNNKNKMQAFGELLKEMQLFIKAYRDIDKHVVMTCLDKVNIDEETGKKTITFNLQGSISQLLPSFFDEVFYLYNHQFLTRTKNEIIAKDRSNFLDEFETASLEIVFDKILGKGKEEKLL